MPSTEAYIRKHLRFNFAIGMLDGGLFGLGLGFGSFLAIIPLFVKQLSDSALLIGLIPAIHNVGWQLPQLLTAGWVSRAKRYKPLVLLTTVHERIPYLGLAAVAWFLPHLTTSTALLLVFGLLIWQGLGSGFAANAWQTMVTKIMPRELHGTFFGTQAAAFNGLAGISAIIAGFILEKMDSPLNFTICFLSTFLAMALSYTVVAQTREPETLPQPAESNTAFLGQSWAILQRDRNFAIFLGVRSLSQFASMAFAFYLIYGVKYFGMNDAIAGIMTGFLLVSQILFSLIMGRLGDRWSHRNMMVVGALAATLSAVVAWLATSLEWFYPVFLLEAVAGVAIWTVPLALTISFAKEHERPLYIGLSNTITAPATILAPVFGGWLADTIGFNATFLISAACGLLMAIMLVLFVKDPVTPAIGTETI
ncbi:MAG TPA: MFS transporter [Anaerolineales bacterium]|nr:MFS transporter [Anaerolineales bacterium]